MKSPTTYARRALAVAIAVVLASTPSEADPGRVEPVDANVTIREEQAPTKVLTIIEENHSLRQMRRHMPYLFSLAKTYAYASSYYAIRHPSLPNYLALAGGSTFGVTDDRPPAAHEIGGRSVFDQALDHGRRALTYAESMPTRCALENSGQYLVRHNPWTYFVDSRTRCESYSVPAGKRRSGRLHRAVEHNRLPHIGFVIPNRCHDAHDCSLAKADAWLKGRLSGILQSTDFTSGRLVVIVTADEDDGRAGNRVLTVVMAAGLSHVVVDTRLTHYHLLGYFDHVLGVRLLRKAKAGFARAFGL